MSLILYNGKNDNNKFFIIWLSFFFLYSIWKFIKKNERETAHKREEKGIEKRNIKKKEKKKEMKMLKKDIICIETLVKHPCIVTDIYVLLVYLE